MTMTKKLMLLRQSGRPVDAAKADAYEADWKVGYDAVELKAEAVYQKKTGKLITTPKMIIMQRMLRMLERKLTLKYGSEEMIDVPKSEKAWHSLVSRFEDQPILIAKRVGSERLIAIIMDQMQG
jgi:hypothetical protein